MLKLLNTQTGIVFTLPDDEAMRVKNQDRSNIFKIVDCGLQETLEPSKATEEEIAKATTVEEVVEDEPEEEKEVEVSLKSLTKDNLYETLKRCGAKPTRKMTRQQLLDLADKLGIE